MSKALVSKAARWLDRQKPSWPTKVRLRELDMRSTEKCVLGQSFAEEAFGGLHGWDVAIHRVPEYLKRAFRNEGDAETWKDEIRKRREVAKS